MTPAQDTEHLREEIEETRHELGETVEALAAKADVKAQAKRKVEEKKDEIVDTARSLSGSAADAVSQVPEKARGNPAALAAAGVLLAGAGLAARRRRRNRKARSLTWLLK